MTPAKKLKVGDPFDALGNPNRRAIIEQLREGPRSVAEITSRMRISQPAVSRHLRVLKDARLVADEPDEARRLYSLSDEGAEAIRAYMQQVWGDAIGRFHLAARNQPHR